MIVYCMKRAKDLMNDYDVIIRTEKLIDSDQQKFIFFFKTNQHFDDYRHDVNMKIWHRSLR